MKRSLLGLILGFILCFGTDQGALADSKKEPKNKVPVSGSRFSSVPYEELPKEIITGAFGHGALTLTFNHSRPSRIGIKKLRPAESFPRPIPETEIPTMFPILSKSGPPLLPP